MEKTRCYETRREGAHGKGRGIFSRASVVSASLMTALAIGAVAVPVYADTSKGDSDRVATEALEVVLPDPFDQTAPCETCHVFGDVADVKVEDADAENAKVEDASKTSSGLADESDGQAMEEPSRQIMALHQAAGCTSCHEVDEWLEKAHKNYLSSSKVPKRLKYTSVSNDACLACHGSWEELAEKTSEVDTCTDVLGTTVNPHGAPETHIADDGQLNCVLCHKAHDEQTAADLDEAAAKACVTCHHNNEYVACTECHAS